MLNRTKPLRNIGDMFLNTLNKEINQVQQKLLAHKSFQFFVDCVPKEKTYNQGGAAINRILTYYENKILQVIWKEVSANLRSNQEED